MPKQYVIVLSCEDRTELESLRDSRAGSARQQARVQALLLSDAGWTDEEIAEEVDLHSSSVERLRKRACQEGWAAAVRERPRSGRPPMLDAKQEAVLVALACEKPPHGRRHWTLRQLGGRLVGLEVVESISHETVRRVLKKTSSSPGRSGRGVCPR
jgi:putative transposase